jgi:hypothetical protein
VCEFLFYFLTAVTAITIVATSVELAHAVNLNGSCLRCPIHMYMLWLIINNGGVEEEE